MKRVKAIFIIWLLLAGSIYVLNGSKAAAAMFIVAAFYCAAALIVTLASGRKIRTEITGEHSINKNVKEEIKVESANESGFPVPSCTLSLVCENVLTKEKETIPGADLLLSYEDSMREEKREKEKDIDYALTLTRTHFPQGLSLAKEKIND